MLGALGRLVAPDVNRLQDLQDHWARFLEYYSSRSLLALKAEPIENTLLTFHLNKILAILIAEQEIDGDGFGSQTQSSLAPCLEFFLHQDILNILVTLCQADTPPGIRPYIFKVFIFLLEKIAYPLVYETACHLPLCRLTLVCSLTKASPTESQEIEFLSLLCDKIKKSPFLVQVFLPSDECMASSNLSSKRSSRSSSMINLHQIETLALNVKTALERVESKHYLGTALLNYLDSSDYCLSCRAMQNLISVSGLKCDESARALIADSPLVDTLLIRISTLFKNIPGNIDPSRVEELEVDWIQAHKLHSTEFASESFPGRSELITFLSFLDYVDDLVDSSHLLIGESMAASVGATIMQLLHPLIFTTDTDQILRGLSYLGVIWNHAKCNLLRDELTQQFFEDCDVEADQPSSIYKQILTNWKGEGEARIESIRLFDTLLSSPHQTFIDTLFARNLEGRGYYNQSQAEGEVTSWSDVEDEREKSRSQSRSRMSRSSSRSRSGSAKRELKKEEVKYISKTMAPANIHRVVNMWLYLVEDQLRLDELRGSGYDLYIKDASRQLEDVVAKCEEFNWGQEAVIGNTTMVDSTLDTASTDSRCESDPSRGFDPGLFLTTLFNSLDTMLEAEYDCNLQLTSILSRLVQLPHPYLHEYLLNPTIPIQDGVITLYAVLRKLMVEATRRCSAVKHYPKKMLHSRKQLLGEPNQSTEKVYADDSERNLFQCVVVVDEFCKELAAISLVKYHLYSSLTGGLVDKR